MTPEQENTNEVRYVFDKLPQTKADLDTLFAGELSGNPEHVLIALSRLRDYYNPNVTTVVAGEDIEDKGANFGRFVYALLLVWLDLSEPTPPNTSKKQRPKKSKALIDPIVLHLKELCVSTHSSATIIAYL